MCEACQHITINKVTAYTSVNRRKLDPTRTTVLRETFAREMRRRFDALLKEIVVAIVKQDVFGLKEPTVNIASRAFAFPTNQQKIDGFMEWLRQRQDYNILQYNRLPGGRAALQPQWTDIFITDSYKRGINRGRYEMGKAGWEVPKMVDTGGINASLFQPFHADRVGILYSRTFNGLKGITDAMDLQVSNVLAQGLIDGDAPVTLARKMRAVITGSGMGDLGITDTLGRFIPAKRRAEMLARTEIIRAHHQATIQEYKHWGAYGVKVQAEWSTAGYNVCEQCAPMEGREFSLADIRGMIPYHPNCRCMALPLLKKDADVAKKK